MKDIPQSVLSLLASRWEHNARYSAFASTFEGERAADPSWYVYRRDDPSGPHELKAFTFAEIDALHQDEVLGRHSREYEHGINTNEHAEHALKDFLGEVYGAWDKFESRLALVDRARTRQSG